MAGQKALRTMDRAYEDDAPAASPPRSAGTPSCRRIATGYDKLDAVFLAFTHLALIFDALR